MSIPFIDLGDISDLSWGNTSITKASYAEKGYPAFSASGCDGYLPNFEFDADGVVLSAIGARCGKCFSASGKWTAIKNTITITKNKTHDTCFRFLYHYLNLDNVWPRRGGGQPFIGLGDARKLPIPKFSFDEQRRIADILDRADALRAKRRAALARLDELTQAIFIEMFGDPVSNPKGWPTTAVLGDVADIVSGVTKGRNLEGKTTRTLPYLAVANVQDKKLNLAAIKSIEATKDEIRRYRLIKNDLLLTEGGDPDKLGRGTLWQDELPECIHQNHIFRVRLNTDRVNSLFLNWLVGSERGKRYFLRSAKQTTGIASINMTQLRGFPLLLPPTALQNTFANCIAGIERLKSRHSAAQFEVDGLFASLQDRAFRGAL